MSVASGAVAGFRTRWATRLIDTCTITQQAAGTLNLTSGQLVAGTDTVRYTGDCLIRPQSRDAAANYGQEKITIMRFIVFVPYDTDGIEPDDRVTLDVVTYDSNLQGAVLRVESVDGDSYNTVRRLTCALDLGGGSSA